MKTKLLLLIIFLMSVGALFAQPVMIIDDEVPDEGADTRGATSYFGLDFTPKGHIHVLYVFVQFENDYKDDYNYEWHPNQVPNWSNDLFYTSLDEFDESATDLTVSNYYYQNSKHAASPLKMTGEALNEVITITPEGNVPAAYNLNYFDYLVYEKLEEKFPDRDWSAFDKRTNYPNFNWDNSTTPPDSKFDYVVIQYRWFKKDTIWLEHIGIEPPSSDGLAGIGTGTISSTQGTWQFKHGHTMAGSDFNFGTARRLFTHELAHNLFTGNHFGGANGELGAYNHFNRFWGSMNSVYNIMDAASAWERYLMGWFDFKDGYDVNESNVKTNPYKLKNFASTNDALRIQIDEDNYLWLEYHDGNSSLDKRVYLTQIGQTVFPQPSPGVYAYITSKVNHRENFDYFVEDNYIKVLNGDGNYDFYVNSNPQGYPGEWWGDEIYTFRRGNSAPYSGFGYNHEPLIDYYNDGHVGYKPILREGDSEPDGEFTYANLAHSSFPLEEYKEYSAFSNPPLVNNTYFEGYKYLNNIKLYLTKNEGANEYWVTVTYTEKEIDEDITFKNNISIPESSTYSITNNSYVTIEKSLMPNSKSSSGLFKPSIFRISDNSTLIIEENSILELKDDSELRLGTNSNLIVNGELRLTASSKLVLSTEVDFNGGEIVLEDQAELVLRDDAFLKNTTISGSGKVILDVEWNTSVEKVIIENVIFNTDVEFIEQYGELLIKGEVTFKKNMVIPNYSKIILKNNAIVNFEGGLDVLAGQLNSDKSNVICNISKSLSLHKFAKIQNIFNLNINYDYTSNFLLQDVDIWSSNVKVNVNHGNVDIKDVKFWKSSLKVNLFSNQTDGFCKIENNEFYDISGNEALKVNNFNMFSIKNNIIRDNSGHGIVVYNSGQLNLPGHIIEGNTIYNNKHNDTAKGIIIYNSVADIRNNEIYDNDFGIALFHNSTVSLKGEKPTVRPFYPTQLIYNNTYYQVHSDATSFPWKFEYNAIRENDSEVARVYYKSDKPNKLLLQNNCWGNNFKPEEDLNPLEMMEYIPVWECGVNPGSGVGGIDEPKLLYEGAITDIQQENYDAANDKLQTIVSDYPESDYTISALKAMPAISSTGKGTFDELINYYQTNATIQDSEDLKKLAGYLIAEINIKEAQYADALSFYEDMIANPPSEEDYVYALIDAGRVNSLIEAGGNKAPAHFKFKHLLPENQEAGNTQSRQLVDGLVKIVKNKEAKSEGGSQYQLQDGLFKVYPNPVTSTANVEFATQESGTVNVSVFDITGKCVYAFEDQKAQGVHKHKISTADIDNGIYFVKVTISGNSETKRIVIAK